MNRVEVHYVGGPADGQHEHVPVGTNGIPATWLAVDTTARMGHARERAHARRRDVHRYERHDTPDTLGWFYVHGGVFG